MVRNKTLSCLLIGCGNIAGGFDTNRSAALSPLTHAGAYSAHGGFALVACVDPIASTRNEFMERWQVAEGYSAMSELERHAGRFDVVSICSPTAAHLNDVKSAISLQPRLIFCEKPLASNLLDAKSIVDACRKSAIPLLVNYNRRWDGSVIRLKSELANGSWGSVRSVSGVYNRGLINNGSHMVDLLHMLFGDLRLAGVGNPVFDGFMDDPSIPATFTTADGVPVTLTCGNARDYSLFELQIVTELGLIAMEDGGLQWRIRRPVDSPHFRNYRSLDDGGERSAGGLPGAMLAAVGEIYRAAHGDGQLSSTGANALSAIRVCEEVRSLAFKTTMASPAKT